MKLENRIARLRKTLRRAANRKDRLFLYPYLTNPEHFRARAGDSFWSALKLKFKGIPLPHFPDWNPGLTHAPGKGTVVLVWVKKNDSAILRDACLNLQRIFVAKNYTPVLVTPLEDFNFYVRLGWLIEYLPRIGGFLSLYRRKKIWYLASRYRDALILPLAAALAEDEVIENLLSRQVAEIAQSSAQMLQAAHD